MDKRNAIVVSNEVLHAVQKAKGYAMSMLGTNLSNDQTLRIIFDALTQEGIESIIWKQLAKSK